MHVTVKRNKSKPNSYDNTNVKFFERRLNNFFLNFDCGVNIFVEVFFPLKTSDLLFFGF